MRLTAFETGCHEVFSGRFFAHPKTQPMAASVFACIGRPSRAVQYSEVACLMIGGEVSSWGLKVMFLELTSPRCQRHLLKHLPAKLVAETSPTGAKRQCQEHQGKVISWLLRPGNHEYYSMPSSMYGFGKYWRIGRKSIPPHGTALAWKGLLLRGGRGPRSVSFPCRGASASPAECAFRWQLKPQH